jgi:exopolyphosphatase/pppGpp-phosphohydrolase
MRIASIDIGTNAVKAKIFDTSATLIKRISKSICEGGCKRV